MEQGNIPILVQPDDIIDLSISSDNFLQRIREWKEGLSKIIFSKLIISINGYLTNEAKNINLKSWIERFGELTFTALGKKIADMQDTYISIPSSQFTALF